MKDPYYCFTLGGLWFKIDTHRIGTQPEREEIRNTKEAAALRQQLPLVRATGLEPARLRSGT